MPTPSPVLRLVAFATAVLVSSSVASAQSPAAGELTIRWRSGDHVRPAQTSASALDVIMRRAAQRDDGHLVVQFDRPVDAAARAELSSAGLTLLAPLGDDAYFASVDADRLRPQALVDFDALRVAEDVRREWKLDGWLRGHAVPSAPPAERLEIPTHALVVRDDADPVVAVYVLTHRDVPVTRGRAAVERHAVAVTSDMPAIGGFVAHVRLSRIAALADEDAVQWIEVSLPRFVGSNNTARSVSQADEAQQPVPTGYGLSGDGVRVMVYDTGPADFGHPAFEGRLTNRDASPVDTTDHAHSTHVAGTIGAGSTASPGPDFRGMAPDVALDVYGFESPSLPDPAIYGPGDWYVLYQDPGDMADDYAHALNILGADISNNSLGSFVAFEAWPFWVQPPFGGGSCREQDICELLGNYGVTSCLIDSVVLGSLGSPFPMVWAVGNDRGWMDPAIGPFNPIDFMNFCPFAPCTDLGQDVSGFGSIGPPGGAKNPIVVGSVQSNESAASPFSNFGPTDDGRIKPDLVATGEDIMSTLCDTQAGLGVLPCDNSPYSSITPSTVPPFVFGEGSGTSFAAPVVTGLGALLIEYHRQAFGGPDPLNSTLKALLVHNADEPGFGANDGPDYETGWGVAKVADTLRFMDPAASPPGFFTEASVSDGDVYEIDVVVMPGEDLKVTLAWDDLPGTPNVGTQLVNDLDLVIRGPDGDINPLTGERHEYFPWTIDFEPFPGCACYITSQTNTKDDGAATAQDDRNNVEQVSLDDPNVFGVPEIWTIEVHGTSVSTPWAHTTADPTQTFSLCVGFDAGSLTIDCDGNGLDDVLEIASTPSLDDNGNGVLDACEPDCNGNGLPDATDLADNFSQDWNGDGIPDECQVPPTHPATAQDDCVDAEPLCPGVHYGANFDADTDPAATPGCTFPTGLVGGMDVWYSYRPAASGTLTLTVEHNAPFPSLSFMVNVWDGCPASGGTELACAAQSGGTQTVLSLPVTAFATYLVRIASPEGAFVGIVPEAFELTVDGPECVIDASGGGHPCFPDIGFGGPGSSRLSVCGPPLVPGNVNWIFLENAAPNALAILFLSLEFNPTTFLGVGTLVTIPIFIQANLATDGQGRFAAPFAGYPGLTGPVAFFAQFAYADAALPGGAGVSNAVKIVFLP